MSSLRFCPRDHTSETDVKDYYTEDICQKCEHYNIKNAANGIVCGYYIIKRKAAASREASERKKRFLKEIEQLSLRIKTKEQMILELRREGNLGTAILALEEKVKLEKMLEKKEQIKKKYFE